MSEAYSAIDNLNCLASLLAQRIYVNFQALIIIPTTLQNSYFHFPIIKLLKRLYGSKVCCLGLLMTIFTVTHKVSLLA